MNAGLLTERLTLQSLVRGTGDGQGGAALVPTTVATVWGQVLSAGASEGLAEGGLGARQAYRVVVRTRADIVPTMQLLWTPYLAPVAKTLQVNGVQPYPKEPRAFLQLECAEVI